MRSAAHAIPFWIVVLLVSGCNSRPLWERLPDVGKPVPAFDLPMLDGSRATPASIAGTPVVVALWATDCGASRLALQALAAIDKDYQLRGVRVLRRRT